VWLTAIVSVTIVKTKQARIDGYVLDTLMADLVGHDHQPSAFLVYLQLLHRSARQRGKIQLSLRELVELTGLSKSAVQSALRTLTRRRLVIASRAAVTAVPAYTVLKPWRR
jgi:DNA-binding GntR family transcriptional regulator